VEGDLPTSGQNSVNVFKQAAVSQTGSSSERGAKKIWLIWGQTQSSAQSSPENNLLTFLFYYR